MKALLLGGATAAVAATAACLVRFRRGHAAPRPPDDAPFGLWLDHIRRLERRLRREKREARDSQSPPDMDLCAETREVLRAHPLREDLRRLADRLERALRGESRAPPGIRPGARGSRQGRR